MIQGYPDQSSIFPGDRLTLHISTDAPQFRVEFYRHGPILELKFISDWRAGANIPAHPSDQDWGLDQTLNGRFFPGWPGYEFATPLDLRPGVYIAMFIEGDSKDNERGNTPYIDRATPDARTGKALFVVKNPVPGNRASILYKIPLLTYQAYNSEGGSSLYTTYGPPITLRRPGGGTGGTPWDALNFDPYEPETPRQVFGHWDAPFVSWLEGNGYNVDYCTDLDIDADVNRSLLGACRLLLSVGHDEYWTGPMRDHVEAFISDGGNVAFFSGNTCYWQITFDDANTIRRPHNWHDNPIPNRSENSLTGVSFRNGGEGDGNRPSVGYIVQHTDHWIFEGTGLSEGERFGFNERLVGYECDGADFDSSSGPPFTPSGSDGTPGEFVILGIGDVSNFNDPRGNQAATMGIYTKGGTVFTGATTDWPRVVARNGEPVTVQITRNVLDSLSSS